jgi:hypothetical protein
MRIFGPDRDEIAGGWIELHNEDLHNLYSSPNIIRLTKDQVRENEIGQSV